MAKKPDTDDLPKWTRYFFLVLVMCGFVAVVGGVYVALTNPPHHP